MTGNNRVRRQFRVLLILVLRRGLVPEEFDYTDHSVLVLITEVVGDKTLRGWPESESSPDFQAQENLLKSMQKVSR